MRPSLCFARPSLSTGLARSILVVGALSALSCGREVTAPEESARVSRAISIRPTFRTAPGHAEVSSGVEFSHLRLTLSQLDGRLVHERVVDFPAASDTLRLSVTVPLSPSAPAAGEQMALRIRFITTAGDTVFRSGPDTILVEPARAGVPPTEIGVELAYTGPGSDATRVELTPVSAGTTGGSALNFSAQAFGALNALVATAPILFTSTDTSVVRFANARSGAATTGSRRGAALVIASLLTGPADTASVSVYPLATSIAAVQGGGQSAPVGAALPSAVIVRVTANDALGVAGVTVAFATPGGSVANANVVTDADGLASTTWTLGPSVGVQSLTATAAGLGGSPLEFTATALAGTATLLAFTVTPATTTAGVPFGPIAVEARDAIGNVATTFVGAVTLAIGTNPGSGVLAGTVTANAVAGVATFAGVSIAASGVGYSLSATAAGLTSVTSASFNIDAGPAAAVVFSGQPLAVTVGLAIAPAVQVTARDAFGNTASTFTGAVTIAVGLNPGGATLSGTTVVNAVAGVATFSGLSLDVSAAGYTLEATSGVLVGATSALFNTSALLVTWTNAAGGAWNVASNWSVGRVPIASDSVEISLAGSYGVSLTAPITASFIAVGGSSGSQTLNVSSTTLTILGRLSTQGTGALGLSSATVTGAGSVFNGGSLSLTASTIATPLTNQGTVVVRGTSAITGALTTTAGSLLQVVGTGSASSAALTVSSGPLAGQPLLLCHPHRQHPALRDRARGRRHLHRDGPAAAFGRR